MAETKPMRPARAWAVIGADGKPSTVENVACLFPARKDAGQWAINTERPLRVRILDDAAVEQAIAAIKDSILNFRRDDDLDPDPTIQLEAAIRDLGGRP